MEPYLDALTRKADAFAELLEVSRGQETLIEREDPEPLLALLGRKKAIIRRIEEIDRDLASARADWETRSREVTRDQATDLLARIRRTLEELMACEEETRRRTEDVKRQTVDEMSRIRQGRRAAEIYRRLPRGRDSSGGGIQG